MAAKLFMLLAEGIAGDSTNFRLGARHALMIYVTASSLENAEIQALRAAFEGDWLHAEIKRVKKIESDPQLIDDDTLRDAAEDALQDGSGIVVYQDEIAPNG